MMIRPPDTHVQATKKRKTALLNIPPLEGKTTGAYAPVESRVQMNSAVHTPAAVPPRCSGAGRAVLHVPGISLPGVQRMSRQKNKRPS